MNYEEMNRATDETVRRVLMHSEICTWILAGAGLVLFTVLGVLVWMEHREKMRFMKAQRIFMEKNERGNWSASAYTPTVGDVDRSNDGNVFYRMGPPRRR